MMLSNKLFWRFYVGLNVIPHCISRPMWECCASLRLFHLTLPLLPTCFANHGRPLAPNDATVNLWNTPSDCQVCKCMSPPYDGAPFWITIQDDIDPNLASGLFLNYSTMLSRGADMRRTGGPRPSHALHQRQLTYQVIHLLSASGHEFPLCVG